jgi:uroporphyrinogen-III synthase
MRSVALVSIGPQTSRHCLEHFGRVDQEANPHDLDGLTQACLQVMQTR